MTTYSSFRPQTQNLVVSGATTLGDASNDVITINANPTLTAGTANGVPYLNGSKVLTTGSALTFDGIGYLTLSGNSTALTGATLSNSNTTAGAGSVLYVNQASGPSTRILSSSYGLSVLGTITNHPLVFEINGAEKMRLTSTGLGIGTSLPGTKLEIAKVGLSSATGATFGAVNIYDTSGVVNTFAALDFSNSAVGGVPIARISSETTNSGTFLRFGTTNNFGLGVTNTALTIDPAGNLGIGVTPSAWEAGTRKAFQMGLGGSVSSDSSVNSILVTSNAVNTSTGWKYINSDYATNYYQTQGQHVWRTAPSGTAGNAISFTQAMTLDASGRLGIGTTTPNDKLEINGGNVIFSGSNWVYSYSGGTFNQVRSGIYYDGTTPSMQFYTAQTERMRIASNGNTFIGTSSMSNPSAIGNQPRVGIQTNGSSALMINGYGDAAGWGMVCQLSPSASGNAGNHIQFYDNTGTNVGGIRSTGATTTYHTSSDYRLKENVQPMQNALATVTQLNPVTYTWKADGSDGQGFIAHELQAVVPDCVTGEKDAVDEEGNPVYQGVDTSFLVATLTKAIQELKSLNDTQATTIASLEARLTALETK